MHSSSNVKGIIIMIFSSMLVALGQFFWKLSAGEINLFIVYGFITYFFGAIAMIRAFKYAQLSVLHPVMAFGYIFAFCLSVFILEESWDYQQIVGIIFILFGVVLLGNSTRPKND